MPNIHGFYTLNETASIVGVSNAWINKMQRQTGIIDKRSIKGCRINFTHDDIITFKRIMMLRKLDYSLKDIIFMYNNEDGVKKEDINKDIINRANSLQEGIRSITSSVRFRKSLFKKS